MADNYHKKSSCDNKDVTYISRHRNTYEFLRRVQQNQIYEKKQITIKVIIFFKVIKNLITILNLFHSKFAIEHYFLVDCGTVLNKCGLMNL